LFTQKQMSPGAECSLMKDSKYKRAYLLSRA